MSRRWRGAEARKRALSTPEGYVYVFVDPGLPGVVKVGRSKKPYESRFIELRNWAVSPKARMHAVPVADWVAAEREAHIVLDEYRLPMSGELFHVCPAAALASLWTIAGQITTSTLPNRPVSAFHWRDPLLRHHKARLPLISDQERDAAFHATLDGITATYLRIIQKDSEYRRRRRWLTSACDVPVAANTSPFCPPASRPASPH